MRPEKEAMAKELKDRMSESSFFILTDYTGMSVAQAEDLRGKLSAADARLIILRNRQFRHVARELNLEGLGEDLKGPTAMVYGAGDVVETTKILRSFTKGNELPVVKLGALQGRVISGEQVAQLADMPPREQMLGTVVGTIAAPLSGLVGVLNQKVASLVYVLQAALDKKQSEA